MWLHLHCDNRGLCTRWKVPQLVRRHVSTLGSPGAGTAAGVSDDRSRATLMGSDTVWNTVRRSRSRRTVRVPQQRRLNPVQTSSWRSVLLARVELKWEGVLLFTYFLSDLLHLSKLPSVKTCVCQIWSRSSANCVGHVTVLLMQEKLYLVARIQ